MPLFRRREARDAPPDDRRRRRPTELGRTEDDGSDWRAYDSIAGAYARIHAPHLALPAGDLVEMLRIGEGARVLDVGTGTGVAARAASAAVGTWGVVVGIDPSLAMLAEARRDGGSTLYVAATAIDLPFREGTFGYVTANFVLSHFQRYDTALFDILRVMAPGGKIGITVWGAGHDRDEFTRAWRSLAEEFAGRRILSDAIERSVPWEERFSDPGLLKEALYDAGIRDIQVERRDYRFQYAAEDYLAGREIASIGRFLNQMLGPALWERFKGRTREVFAQRFPLTFNDFRDVLLAIGTKPKA
jgi:ubiquinone/menaquinone biosynthesis C-methylase UbiE